MPLKVLFIIFLLLVTLAQGCKNANYITVKHVKPVNRNRYYSKKKDRRKKRVKYVKVRVLKKSPEIKPAKSKVVKKESSIVEDEETGIEEGIEEPTNENDSTGFF